MLRTAAFLVCAAILARSQEWPSDQIGIERAITSLNDPARRSSVFAQDGDARSRYVELRASIHAADFRILGRSSLPVRS